MGNSRWGFGDTDPIPCFNMWTGFCLNCINCLQLYMIRMLSASQVILFRPYWLFLLFSNWPSLHSLLPLYWNGPSLHSILPLYWLSLINLIVLLADLWSLSFSDSLIDFTTLVPLSWVLSVSAMTLASFFEATSLSNTTSSSLLSCTFLSVRVASCGFPDLTLPGPIPLHFKFLLWSIISLSSSLLLDFSLSPLNVLFSVLLPLLVYNSFLVILCLS